MGGGATSFPVSCAALAHRHGRHRRWGWAWFSLTLGEVDDVVRLVKPCVLHAKERETGNTEHDRDEGLQLQSPVVLDVLHEITDVVHDHRAHVFLSLTHTSLSARVAQSCL